MPPNTEAKLKKIYPFMMIGLAALLALGGCAPAPAVPATEAAASTSAPQSATEAPPASVAPTSAAPTVEVPTQSPALVVTPRGDALEATDPTTVALGAGQPVLVEFFAFW